MGLDPESTRFLKGMDERAKGFDPEISRLVDELRFEQLGKPIVYMATTPSQRAQEQAVASLQKLASIPQPSESTPQTHEEELIGYILPVDADQNRHLVILKDGTMFVTEAYDDYKLQAYRSHFAVSNQPLEFIRSPSLARVKAYMTHYGGTFANKVLHRNDNPADVAQIDAAREQATQVAYQLKEQRMKAVSQTSGRLIESFRDLLFPPKPPQPDQPQ